MEDTGTRTKMRWEDGGERCTETRDTWRTETPTLILTLRRRNVTEKQNETGTDTRRQMLCKNAETDTDMSTGEARGRQRR